MKVLALIPVNATAQNQLFGLGPSLVILPGPEIPFLNIMFYDITDKIFIKHMHNYLLLFFLFLSFYRQYELF